MAASPIRVRIPMADLRTAARQPSCTLAGQARYAQHPSEPGRLLREQSARRPRMHWLSYDSFMTSGYRKRRPAPRSIGGSGARQQVGKLTLKKWNHVYESSTLLRFVVHSCYCVRSRPTTSNSTDCRREAARSGKAEGARWAQARRNSQGNEALGGRMHGAVGAENRYDRSLMLRAMPLRRISSNGDASPAAAKPRRRSPSPARLAARPRLAGRTL
jgi:hypothetical protein